jgi:hypothetical protein
MRKNGFVHVDDSCYGTQMECQQLSNWIRRGVDTELLDNQRIVSYLIATYIPDSIKTLYEIVWQQIHFTAQ